VSVRFGAPIRFQRNAAPLVRQPGLAAIPRIFYDSKKTTVPFFKTVLGGFCGMVPWSSEGPLTMQRVVRKKVLTEVVTV
jgi:hypothetical protein